MASKPLCRILSLAYFAWTTIASQPTCGNGKQCPLESPCCSPSNLCGVGAYCLGGCDPTSSYSAQSCMPAPVCQPGTYTFANLSTVSKNTEYLGGNNTSWVSYGDVIPGYDSEVVLNMSPNTVGFLLASTFYVWYGRVTATIYTTAGRGVITSFTLLSNTGDEMGHYIMGVDPEFVHFHEFSRSVIKGGYQFGSGVKDFFTTNETYYSYTIDWTPEYIDWYVNDTMFSSHQRWDDWNISTNRYDYPQTPARIQIAVWDGGLSSNNPDLVEYAGGSTDWDAGSGYDGGFFIGVMNVTVECYDPPDGANAGEGKGKAYVYDDQTGGFTNKTVSITDDETVLADFCSSGIAGSRGVGCDNSVPELGIAMFGTYGKNSVKSAENGAGQSASTTSSASGAPSSSSGSPASDASHGLSTGAKAGIGIGSAIVVLLLAVIVLLVVRYQRRKRTRDGQQIGQVPFVVDVDASMPPPQYEERAPEPEPVDGIAPMGTMEHTNGDDGLEMLKEKKVAE